MIKQNRLISWLVIAGFLLMTACTEEERPVPATVEGAAGVTVTKASISSGASNATPPGRVTTQPAQPSTKAAATVEPLPAGTVAVELNFEAVGSKISPLIYGLAGTDETDPAYTDKLKPTLLRWGGNPSTRFNWVLGNAWNAGRDYEFRNGDYGNPGKDVANDTVQYALTHNMEMLLTIPTIGWVAKNSDNNIHSLNVPDRGGPPVSIGSDELKGYNPAANRALTSVKSEPRKNAPFVVKPVPNSPVIYQDEWVASLVKRFGPASSGGVRFYDMDNEPDAWSYTHTDVSPAQLGYDQLLSRFIDYASAVKDVDRSAEIGGPVSWGWTGYFYSPLDQGDDNYKTAQDRARHGNVPFIPWFLDQLHQYEQKTGQRILDVLDINYYPQAAGVYPGTTDPRTGALRLRSTRSLWSSTYIDESWINTPVNLIPRMRAWIDQYYPGTKLGITEWNWGADTTLNGALAIGQVLGIFGREGIYKAAYWRFPPVNSPGYYAFKLYTNFDDKGGTFGDTSIPLKVTDDSKISVFAALDSKSGRARLMLINTQSDVSQKIEVRLAWPLPSQQIGVYQLSLLTGNKIAAQEPINFLGGLKIKLELAPYSITLLDLDPGH